MAGGWIVGERLARGAESVDGQDAGLSVQPPVAPGRHRRHRSPARTHVVKVLYDDEERAAVEQAAELAGLRPSSFVAAAALRSAQHHLQEPELCRGSVAGGAAVWSPAEDRDVLAELIQARLALRRYGVNLNQAVAALHRGQHHPLELASAVRAADRAVVRVDAAAAAVARRLS